MDNLQSVSLEQASLGDFLDKSPISFSASEIQRSVPRINFKKLKLSKLQNIGNLVSKTTLPSFVSVDIVESGQLEQNIYEDNQSDISPLRKKSDSQFNVASENLESQESINNEDGVLFDFSEALQENKKDESSDGKEIISSSGEQSAFVWPPKEKQTKRVEEKDPVDKKQKHKKKKTYFLSSEQEFVPEVIDKTNFSTTSSKENISSFPWANSSQEYETIESLFHGGLETELLDNPVDDKEEIKQDENSNVPIENDLNNEQKNIFNENDKDLELLYEKSEEPQTLFLKAIGPEQFGFEEDELIKNLNWGGKTKDMNYKHNRKNNNGNAVRVVVWGGLLLTCGYFALNYFMPEYKNIFFKKEKDEKIYVRDLFKKTHSYKTQMQQSKPMSGDLESLELSEEEDSLKPITEQDRIALIQKAKESIESKDDPFGQDLPQEVIDEMAASAEKKPLPDVPVQRKQVELVGVISTDNKNLALVNVYIADYTIASEDDKEAKETKLKTALSMTVPNRLEVSLLDPVEDWYVKQILKSKSRNEDPIIELVKGDKKFKLKVGQKVLLPEEKTIALEKE